MASAENHHPQPLDSSFEFAASASKESRLARVTFRASLGRINAKGCKSGIADTIVRRHI